MGLYKKIKVDEEKEIFESDGQEEKIININKNKDMNDDLWLMQNSLKIESRTLFFDCLEKLNICRC